MSQDIQEKDRALFDRIAVTYSKKDTIPSSRDARKYQLLAGMNLILEKQPHINTIIEIGCGIGASAAYLRGRFDHYVGLDYSEEQIKHAKLLHGNDPSLTFYAMNVKDMSTETVGSADVVLAVGAFHHFTELEAVFAAIRKVMKPGAHLIAIEPQRENPIVQTMRWFRTKVDKKYSSDQVYFGKDELKTLFEQNGFVNVVVKYQGYVTPPFAQVPLYPQCVFHPLSKLAINIDTWCDRALPTPFQRLSWNIVARAQLPE